MTDSDGFTMFPHMDHRHNVYTRMYSVLIPKLSARSYLLNDAFPLIMELYKQTYPDDPILLDNDELEEVFINACFKQKQPAYHIINYSISQMKIIDLYVISETICRLKNDPSLDDEYNEFVKDIQVYIHRVDGNGLPFVPYNPLTKFTND